MALEAPHTHDITYRCPNCQATIDISTPMIGDTVECPSCSVPFEAVVPEGEPLLNGETVGEEAEYSIRKPTDDESVIAEVHPAMFRKHPIQFVLLTLLALISMFYGAAYLYDGAVTMGTTCFVVVLVVAGYFGYWWLEIIATKLTVTNKRTTLRHGIIAKKTSEVQHDDIRNLQVDQNALERILGIGDIAISSSGQDDLEVVAQAIPSPNDVADLIRRMQ